MMRLPAERKWQILAVCVVAVLISFVIAVAAYQTLRRTFARLSLDYYYPYFHLVNTSGNSAARAALTAKSKTDLVRQIESLQRELSMAESKLALLEQTASENESLRAAMNMPSYENFTSIFSEVLLRDPVSWSQTFTIRSGSDHGVRPGDLVAATLLSELGRVPVTAVVGRVESVSKHTAVVCTILNSECTLSITLAKTNVHGLLRGKNSDYAARISFLPRNAIYSAGEQVVTSGFSHRIPSGIPVGTLPFASSGAAEIHDKRNLYAESDLLPMFDLNRIRFVTVFSRKEEPAP